MRRNLFFRIFPPPDFLRMPVAGFDISDESVHIAELANTSNGREIKRLIKRPVPKGLIEDGKIKNAEQLKIFFTQLRKDFKLKHINVSLPEQHGYVVIMRIPKVRPDEIYESLELQIEENVPIPAKDAIFDYDIIKDAGTGPYMELNVTVFPRQFIEEYLKAFEDTGLVPVCFEVEAHALSRAVVPREQLGTYMILDFGKTRTGITIANNDMVLFSSTISVGGDTVTKSIARNLEISFDEAEKMKKEGGLFVGQSNQNAMLALTTVVSAMKGEVMKHYQYWNTHLDQFGKKRQTIDTILLCGGFANMPGLPEYLASGLHPDIRVANVFVNVNSFDVYIPNISLEESLQYATSIGLALKSDR